MTAYEPAVTHGNGTVRRGIESTSLGRGRAITRLMVYDAVRGYVVLFWGSAGSELLGDTWIWDGKAWREVAGPGPPPRGGAIGIAFDSRLQRVVLYGGGNDKGDFTDLWKWTGAWQLVE